MLTFRLNPVAGWLTLVSLAIILTFGLTLRPAAAQTPDHTIYLPFINKVKSPTPAPPPASALFIDTELKTSSADIQVDSNGGQHLTYSYYEAANDGKPTSGVYLYCASNCQNSGQWTGVGLGEQVNEIQLRLTPGGQPRIVFRATSQARENGNDYFYAACDQNCTDPARWGLIYLTSSSGIGVIDLLKDDSLPQRYFALDPDGRPRFVYNDGVTGHLGTFYAYCDGGCLEPANWYETRINKDNGNQGPYRDEDFYYPALTFSPDGLPRIAADGVSLQDETYLYYLACDGGCEAEVNWYSVPLAERGSGPNVSYDIAIDAAGRPRLIFYQGAMLGGQGDQLLYAWCNDDCFDGNNWAGDTLNIGQNNGRGPDLELDATGRPRIAYALYDAGGLGYSWCNSNCETAGAAWQHQIVESRADLLTAWPVAYPQHCDGGLWDGVAPALALDPSGNPRLAYDTTYYARCWYNPDTGEWDPWHEFHLVWRAVRVVFFAQP